MSQPRAIEYLPVAEVTRAQRNPKAHDIEAVKASIRRFGFVDGAVHDGRTGRIIAGHGRLESLQQMVQAGEDPPEGVVIADDGGWLMPVQVGWASKSDAEAEALLVMLNKATELGGWNNAELAELLTDLRDGYEGDLFELSGFVETELDSMIADLAIAEFDDDADAADDLDDVPLLPVDPVSVEGDVWVLGPHRLVCGSATDRGAVHAALGGAEPAMLFTDPPYGVSYTGGTGLRIKNDDLAADDLGRLLVDAFTVARDVLPVGGVFYVCSPSGLLESTFRAALAEVELGLHQQVVWAKDAFVMGRSDYHLQHETLLYGWKEGAAHLFQGGRTQSTVWSYPRPRRSKEHPTMKPVALCRRAVLNSSKPGARVLDVFAGSGSIMMATQSCGRVSSMVELDPKYVDVICRRWQEHSGVAPVLASPGARGAGVAQPRAGQEFDFCGEGVPVPVGGHTEEDTEAAVPAVSS